MRSSNEAVFTALVLTLGLGIGDAWSAPISRKELAEIYLAQRTYIKSFHFQYKVSTENLVAMEKLKDLEKIVYLEQFDVDQYWEEGKWSTLIRHFAGQPDNNQKSQYVYEGGKYLVERVHILDESLAPPRWRSSQYRRFSFPKFDSVLHGLYWQSVGYTIVAPIAASQPKIIQADVVRELKKTETNEIKESTVDGDDCLELRFPGRTYWLLPNLGYAVKKQHIFHDGNLRYEVRNGSFVKVAPKTWLPKKIDWYLYPQSSAPADVRDIPILRQVVALQSFSLNPPIEKSVFTTKIPKGELVIDFTVSPLDQAGEELEGPIKQAIAYREPSDPKNLADVVHAAQMAVGASIQEKEAEKGRARTLYLTFFGLGALLASLLVWRYFLKQRRHSTSSQ